MIVFAPAVLERERTKGVELEEGKRREIFITRLSGEAVWAWAPGRARGGFSSDSGGASFEKFGENKRLSAPLDRDVTLGGRGVVTRYERSVGGAFR